MATIVKEGKSNVIWADWGKPELREEVLKLSGSDISAN